MVPAIDHSGQELLGTHRDQTSVPERSSLLVGGQGNDSEGWVRGGKSTEWAMGQRAATEAHPGEEEKDCAI